MSTLHFFSEESQNLLQAFLQKEAHKVLFAFDFDGTLAPIVLNPEEAFIPSDTLQFFKQLSSSLPTGVITGRALKDIKTRVPKENIKFIIGNHGLEGVPGQEIQETEYKKQTQEWVKLLNLMIPPEEGIFVENKNSSISIHYRNAKNESAAIVYIEKALAQLPSIPHITSGKKVFNVLPAKLRDKGTALQELLKGSPFSRAIYIGDDVTDEDVFSLENKNIFTVKVGPEETKAKTYIPSQKDINYYLKNIIKLMEDYQR